MSQPASDRPLPAGSLATLIVASVIAFSLETLPGLSASMREALDTFEIVVVAIFTVEYILRVYSSSNRWRFVFSFFGLIDLIAIAPFYFGLAVDLRSLRLLRLLRTLRLLKLARYSAAIGRLTAALRASKDEIVVSVAVLGVVLYLSAFGIYHFEHAAQPEKFTSIFDALWWAVATVTTVGYGDVYPITIGGRIFTFCILIVSLGLVSIPTGIFATALLAVRKRESSPNQ